MTTVDIDYLQSLGFSFFPVPYGKKKAEIPWARFQKEKPDADAMRNWRKRKSPSNFATVTGKVSGVIVIETDGDEGRDNVVKLGGLPPTLTAKSARGYHYYFKHPGFRVPNSAGAIAPGIDVRGDGGYVIAPGSMHPSGVLYEWCEGETEIAELPAEWLERVRPKERPAKAVPAVPDAVAPAPGLVINDASIMTADDNVVPFVALPVPTDDNRERAYALAALDGEVQQLAKQQRGTRNHGLNKAAFVLGGYVKSKVLHETEVVTGLMAAAQANGMLADDGEQAARATIASGFDKAPLRTLPPPSGEALPMKENGSPTVAQPGMIGPTFATADDIDLTVLRETVLPTPDLPLDVFGPCADLLTKAAAAANAPVDYVAMSLLAGASAMLGNARWASAFNGTFEQPPVLWLANVGEPSAGKSPAIKSGLGALKKIEGEELERHKPEVDDYEQAFEVAKANETAWKDAVKAAAKARLRGDDGDGDGGDRDQQEGDCGEPPMKPKDADLPAKPPAPCLLLNDSTVEALVEAYVENPRGFLITREELAGWILSFERYSNTTARPLYLESYDGGPYKHRTKSGGTVVIPHLSLAVFGGMQPDKFDRLIVKSDDDGFAARFLYVQPQPVRFAVPAEAFDPTPFADAFRRLRGLVMGRWPDTSVKPTNVALTPEADARFEEWCKEHDEPPLAGGKLYQHWCGKGRGHVLRLAVNLEHLAWAFDPAGMPQPASIGLAAVENAIGLYDYFDKMARKVFGLAGLPEADRNAAQLGRWIVRTQAKAINVRETYTNGIAGMKKPEQVRAAAQKLLEAGILIVAMTRAGDLPGRKREDYAVNPALWDALTKWKSA